MSTVTEAPVAPAAATERPPARGTRRRWTYFVLPIYSAGVVLYLLIPIAVMILYSFNQSRSHLPQVTFNWQGFTTQWYKEWNQVPGLTPAFFLSLRLGISATLISTVIGTLLALALVRYRFVGKGVGEQVLFLNIAAPEIVLGSSLLGFFITINLSTGFVTLLISHVMFSVAYVAITVRARLSVFDPMLEQAAQDLGATPWATFRKVTLPLIAPGIMAGALMAFALSIDDFVTSNFVSGNVLTFPLWVYGAVKVGIPPQVFVLGTFIFSVGVLIAIMTLVNQGRRARQLAKPAKPARAG
ncbi:MAG: ABC transporter permease [Actinobacteria bacterium]|nr:ABC transporter permease [Actinomycetota bacterium]